MEQQLPEAGQVAKPMTLAELPSEILLNIFSYLESQDHMRLCLTAQRLKYTHIEFLLHLHRVHLRSCTCEERKEQTICALYNILQWTIGNYVLAGYDCQYCPGLNALYDFLHLAYPKKVCTFSLPYYGISETQRVNYKMHLAILNTLSLFNLLNKFKTFKVLKFEKDELQWRISFQIKGYYMGYLKLSSERTNNDKRNALFHMVSQLLYCDMLEISIEKDWNPSQIGIYRYGRKRSGSTIFYFTVETKDSVVLDLLKPALCGGHEPITNPLDKLERDVNTFNINITVECRAALSWTYDKEVLSYTYCNEE